MITTGYNNPFIDELIAKIDDASDEAPARKLESQLGALFKKVTDQAYDDMLGQINDWLLNNMADAIRDTVTRTANKVIESAIEKVRSSIREGENITTPLMRTKVFPPLVVRMISVGEQTGELEKMLTKIADFYDDQVDAAVSGITSLIEPLIIAFLGTVVGGIVICMFLPIFKIATIIK